MKLLKKFLSLNMRMSDYIARKFPDFVKEDSYYDQMMSLVNENISKRTSCSVLEVGGIDRPLLNRSSEFTYDGLDIEHKVKCDMIYDNFYVQSIEQPIKNKYDLIISMTLLEHVRDNTAAMTRIYEALKPGGISIHYAPSRYHPYSILLRLIGPKWQKKLIAMLTPWAVDVAGYEAFFDKCSPKDMRTLGSQIGFKTIRITSYFRANDYFKFCFPSYLAVTCWENFCKKIKLQNLCSGMVIVMEKSLKDS